ncbi:hypothetical protein GCM10028801_45670 [Nocardioides maradonensis]
MTELRRKAWDQVSPPELRTAVASTCLWRGCDPDPQPWAIRDELAPYQGVRRLAGELAQLDYRPASLRGTWLNGTGGYLEDRHGSEPRRQFIVKHRDGARTEVEDHSIPQ